MRLQRLVIFTLFAIAPASESRAENIDLSTVPRRDFVQLTIYNSEDITLVRETRAVTFKKGPNPLQFSWANTRIDPTSVELKFLSSSDKLEVVDTTFPHAKPQMLYWNVQSDLDGEAMVQITYFTSGITWAADHTCIANRDETEADVDCFVRVTNQSGEAYENARVRLVVGTINLVEQIAQLAGIEIDKVKNMPASGLAETRNKALYRIMGEGKLERGAPAHAGVVEEKQVAKEGLSEYFIYTIEGTETITSGWSKRMRSFEARGVPLKIHYRYRPREYGDALVRLYVMVNNKDAKLGATPLPDGAVRVFRDNGRGGLSFVAQQSIKYVPIGDKIELNLGADPEVVLELRKRRAFRDNVWLQIAGTNNFKQVGKEAFETEARGSVVGWDEHSVFDQTIRNYTSRLIDVEIRRSYEGDAVFRSGLEPQRHDFQTVALHTEVAPGARKNLSFEVVQRQGRNMKRSGLRIEDAAAK